MKCEICKKEAKMYWKDKERKNGKSEIFYTNKAGQSVCIHCLTDEEVNNFRGLHELNEQRKNQIK